MKKVAVILLSLTLFLSGCSLLDGFFYEEMRDPVTNEITYVDVEATEALPQEMQDAGQAVLVKASDRIDGREYEVAYTDSPSAEYGAVGSVVSGIGNALGGWGILGTALFGGLFSLYSGIRGKRRLVASEAGRKAALLGAAEIASVLADYNSGKMDTNKNGKVSMAEVGVYLVKRGKSYANPEFVQSIINIVTSSMSESEKQAALEKAAENL